MLDKFKALIKLDPSIPIHDKKIIHSKDGIFSYKIRMLIRKYVTANEENLKRK